MDDAPAAHRLRPWTTRRCAAALPTAATFDHMPTAFDHEDGRKEAKTTASPRVTFLREATRPDFLSVAVYLAVARVRIGLQNAVVTPKVLVRMLALAVG